MKIKNLYKYQDDNIFYHLMILKLKKTTYNIIIIEDFNLQALIKQIKEEYIDFYDDSYIHNYFYKNVGSYNALNIVGYESYFVLDENTLKLSNKKITNKINKYIANNSCN